MSIPAIARPTFSPRRRIAPLEAIPPAWVQELLRTESGETAAMSRADDRSLEVTRRDPFLRVTTRIANAAQLDGTELSRLVSQRYAMISRLLADQRKHPIRFWNYVPGIVDPLPGGIDRYMAFNRGRHAAYMETWASGGQFERSVPAASAVGIASPDLVIDCLSSDTAGSPIENPRQIASWRYSRRYGPRPPCFARGTITTIGGRRLLLLAGTASIVGEESRHPGDARAQVGEILRNLEAVISSATSSAGHSLERLTDLRIYVVHAEHLEMVERELRSRTKADVRIESAVARVCRPELLVEAEGVAAL